MLISFPSGARYVEAGGRNYDVGWLIPDEELVRIHDGVVYTHQSRPQWKETEVGHPLYKKGVYPLELIPGFPMTIKWPGDRIPLTGKPTGELWRLTVLARGGTTSDYLQIIKDGVAFTDYTGGNACNPVWTTNNPFYWLGDRADIGGEEHISFRTIKAGSLSYMQGQIKEWPMLGQLNATISLRTYNGRGVTWFPQMGGLDVPFMPYGKTEIGWFPANRVRMLTRTEPIPNSYFPPR